jgi:hypothetical protein
MKFGLNAPAVLSEDLVSKYANEDERLRLMYRTNLETALSGLSLYVKASYDFILALV